MHQETMNHVLTSIADFNRVAGAEIARLSQSDCKDEANLVRIRLNVANIVKSVVATLGMQDATGEMAKIKLRHIADEWEAHRAEAEAHGDKTRAAVEEIKLQAMRGYLDMMEDAHGE